MSRTLSIQSSLFVGLPQAQRNVGLANATFTGDQGDDVYQQLVPGASYTAPDPITAFTAFASGPLVVVMDSQPPLTMQELMIVDSPVAVLSFTNNGTATVQLHLTYVGD